MGALKNSLKKILPPPVNSFMREINRVVALEEKNQELLGQIAQKVTQQEEKIAKQEEILSSRQSS